MSVSLVLRPARNLLAIPAKPMIRIEPRAQTIRTMISLALPMLRKAHDSHSTISGTDETWLAFAAAQLLLQLRML